jgi:integration host factor subunit alpha
MSLVKAELAAKLALDHNLDAHDAALLVGGFFEIIRETLARGEAVKLSGFGQFDLRDKRSRPGLNPKTREPVPVTARRVVTFKPAAALKQRVAGHRGGGGG